MGLSSYVLAFLCHVRSVYIALKLQSCLPISVVLQHGVLFVRHVKFLHCLKQSFRLLMPLPSTITSLKLRYVCEIFDVIVSVVVSVYFSSACSPTHIYVSIHSSHLRLFRYNRRLWATVMLPFVDSPIPTRTTLLSWPDSPVIVSTNFIT